MKQNYFTEIGQSIEYKNAKNYKIKIRNSINLLIIAIYVLVGTIYLSFGDTITSTFIYSLIILNLIAFGLQRIQKHNLSLSLLLGSGYFSIFYFDSYAGLESGAFTYYFPSILSLGFLYDFKKDKNYIIANIVVIISLAFIHIFTGHSLFESNLVTKYMKTVLLSVNVFLSIMMCIFFTFFPFEEQQY